LQDIRVTLVTKGFDRLIWALREAVTKLETYSILAHMRLVIERQIELTAKDTAEVIARLRADCD